MHWVWPVATETVVVSMVRVFSMGLERIAFDSFLVAELEILLGKI